METDKKYGATSNPTDVTDMFDEIDVNHDGYITIDELTKRCPAISHHN